MTADVCEQRVKDLNMDLNMDLKTNTVNDEGTRAEGQYASERGGSESNTILKSVST